MEKLIELLREYNRNKEWYRLALIEYITIDWVKYEVWMKDKVKDMYKYELNIISKKFWFIQRLVENDKINKHGIPEFYPVSDHCLECVYEWITDNTIMLLSIQKNPIDYFISLLK